MVYLHYFLCKVDLITFPVEEIILQEVVRGHSLNFNTDIVLLVDLPYQGKESFPEVCCNERVCTQHQLAGLHFFKDRHKSSVLSHQ